MFLIGVFLWKPILARANFLQNENKFSKIHLGLFSFMLDDPCRRSVINKCDQYVSNWV